MTRRSPQDVFRTLLDISSSQVNSKPISDQDRITQLEKELEETKRLVGNIPSRFTMDPMQRSAQAMLSLFVSLIIVFVVLAFASSRKSTPAWQNQKKELISTGDGNRMITLYEDFTAETTDAKGVRRQATEDEKSVVESVYISNEFAKQRR